jgi:hypothetical protein
MCGSGSAADCGTDLKARTRPGIQPRPGSWPSSIPEHELVERFSHARGLQQLHRVVERADAGQHDVSRAGQLVGAAGRARLDVEALVRVDEGLDVAEPVVDDRDHRMMARCTPKARSTRVPRSMKVIALL